MMSCYPVGYTHKMACLCSVGEDRWMMLEVGVRRRAVGRWSRELAILILPRRTWRLVIQRTIHSEAMENSEMQEKWMALDSR